MIALLLAVLIPAPLYGVTLDNVAKTNALVASLAHLPHRPTIRVVFDKSEPPSYYIAPLKQLRSVAYVMGELLDSSDFPVTQSFYTARVQKYVAALGPYVDVWEIANEINGEWLRQNPGGSDATVATEEIAIGQMVDSAYTVVHNTGGKTAVTLYYNDDGSKNCWQNHQDSWRTWSAQFMPAEVLQGADYVLFSYYPYGDCPHLNPNWTADFAALESTYPNARVGFGEIGTSSVGAPQSVQDSILTTYYSMRLNDPRFISGCFWWYYAEEMVPYQTSHYWQLLDQSVK